MNKAVLCLSCILVLAVQACGSNPARKSISDGADSLSDGAIARQIGEAKLGDRLVMYDAENLGVDKVIAGRKYFSASGRECRRILNLRGKTIDRVACRDDDKAWYLAQPLNNGEVTAMKKDTATAQRVSIDTAETITVGDDGLKSFALKRGETLWSFSERTTGNPRNWQSIADHNSVEDINRVPAGTMLSIPSGL
ncbi:MAG: DVU3141 family protein [Granulosicoccus sp.]